MRLGQEAALDEDVDQPEHVIGYVVGNRAAVCEDGQQLEPHRLVGFQYLGQALDFIEEPEQSEDLPCGGDVFFEVVVHDHIGELVCV